MVKWRLLESKSSWFLILGLATIGWALGWRIGLLIGVIFGVVLSFLGYQVKRATSEWGIHDTARMGNVTRIKTLLLGDPSLLNARDGSGNTPLHCGIGYFELAVVEELLAQGADVNAQDNNGTTPLHLLAAGVPPDLPPGPARAHGTEGAQQIYLRIADLLLAHNADRGLRSTWGWTPLETAEKANTQYMVDILRETP